MTELRIHQAGLQGGYPELRIHQAGLTTEPVSTPTELRIHQAGLTAGPPPVGVGGWFVRVAGQWVKHNMRVRAGGQWL